MKAVPNRPVPEMRALGQPGAYPPLAGSLVVGQEQPFAEAAVPVVVSPSVAEAVLPVGVAEPGFLRAQVRLVAWYQVNHSAGLGCLSASPGRLQPGPLQTA